MDPADGVLGDAPRIDQRADGIAIAHVDARVMVGTPDQQVAGLGVLDRVRHRAVVVEPVVVAGDRPSLAADPIEQASLLVHEVDEA